MPPKSGSILEHHHSDSQLNLIECLRFAKVNNEKSLFSQIKDVILLSFGSCRLSPEEYYYYSLFKDSDYTFEEKARFLGKKRQIPIYLECNPPTWWHLAHDKLAYYALMRGLSFPVPEIQAILHPVRYFDPAITCRNALDVAAYLRERARYPIFGKPVSGMWSVGICHILGFDPAGDRLALSDGRTVGVEPFADEIAAFGAAGYLFQDVLRPHEFIRAVCGDRIATVRFVVIVTDDGPELLHAVWKIPAGENVADNFWREGNLLANLNSETGEILRVVRGVGPRQTFPDSHPDSGHAFKGAKLPEWGATTSLCLRAAAALPDLRLQAWDVALTERGPVLLELNIGGDFNLPQIACGRGLMDTRFREFLASCRKASGGYWARRSRRGAAKKSGIV